MVIWFYMRPNIYFVIYNTVYVDAVDILNIFNRVYTLFQ